MNPASVAPSAERTLCRTEAAAPPVDLPEFERLDPEAGALVVVRHEVAVALELPLPLHEPEAPCHHPDVSPCRPARAHYGI